MAIGEIYPFEYAAKLKLESLNTDEKYIEDLIKNENKNIEENDQDDIEIEEIKKGKKKNIVSKKSNAKKLKEILFKILPNLHQQMIDNILKDFKLSPNAKATKEHVTILKIAADHTIKFLKEFKNSNPYGYLSYKKLESSSKDLESKIEDKIPADNEEKQIEEAKSPASEDKIKFFEFSPLPIPESPNFLIKKLETFDKAVDDFFSKIYEPVDIKKEKEKIAWKKYENIKVGIIEIL